MKVSDYCDAINAEIIVRRYSNQDERWTARFEDCEVQSAGCLVGEYGNGVNPLDALDNYLGKIRGETIVFAAHSGSRREFVVPQGLEL